MAGSHSVWTTAVVTAAIHSCVLYRLMVGRQIPLWMFYPPTIPFYALMIAHAALVKEMDKVHMLLKHQYEKFHCCEV